MLACLLWFDMRAEWRRNQETSRSEQAALYDAMDAVLERQRDSLAFPRRFDGTIKEIWALQSRFEQRAGARPHRLLAHPRFRAGYDFLLIRARGGDAPTELADWWARFPNADEAERKAMQAELAGESTGKSPRKRRRRRRKPEDGGGGAEVD